MASQKAIVLTYSSLAVLSVALCYYAWLSPMFQYQIPWLDRPNSLVVGTMVVAGISYLLFVLALVRFKVLSVRSILVSGLLLRLLFLPTTPVYEDDFFRYFWDAELTAQGINPYSIAPIDVLPSPFDDIDQEIAEDEAARPDVVSKLTTLDYLDRVAYPTIRTIYPPLSQAFFALAHWISPASLVIWRLILLLTDCIAVGVLLVLLKELRLNLTYIGIYWLNPISIIETIGAAHMDVLLIPFLLATVLYQCRKKYHLSGIFLGAAVGIKLWPVILAPFVFRPLLYSPSKLLSAAAPFSLLACLFLLPQLLTRFDDQAGLFSYATTWQTNSFLFPLMQGSLAWVSDFQFAESLNPELTARLSVVFLVIGVIIYCLRKFTNDPTDVVKAVLVTTAALLLFSPTAYPWYFLWILPWLAIIPHWGLLLLTVTLPFYYLRYFFEAMGQTYFYESVIIPLEFIPVLLLTIFIHFRQPE